MLRPLSAGLAMLLGLLLSVSWAAAQSGQPRLGLKIDALTDENRRQHGITHSVSGALISAVEPGSDAASKGLTPGHVIAEIGGEPIVNLQQVPTLLQTMYQNGRPAVLLRIFEPSGDSRHVAVRWLSPAPPTTVVRGEPVPQPVSPSRPTPQTTGAAERLFFKHDQACFLQGGQSSGVQFSLKDGQSHYMEIIGSVEPVEVRVCDDSGTMGFLPGCRNVRAYNFSTMCAGGLVKAPDFYISIFYLHGSPRNFRVNGGQLSYLPSADAKARVVFPASFAPFENMHRFIERVPWDEQKGRPRVAHVLSSDQEARIAELFPQSNGYVLPFSAARLQQMASIANEPAPRQVAPSQPSVPSSHEPERPKDAPGAPSATTLALWALSAIAAFVMFMLKSGMTMWQRSIALVIVGTAVGLIVSLTKVSLGLDTQITLLSIPIIFGLVIAFILT